MNKEKADDLIEKLISGRIGKAEFEQILSGIDDPGHSIYIENSMKRHFLDSLAANYKKSKSKAGDGGKE